LERPTPFGTPSAASLSAPVARHGRATKLSSEPSVGACGRSGARSAPCRTRLPSFASSSSRPQSSRPRRQSGVRTGSRPQSPESAESRRSARADRDIAGAVRSGAARASGDRGAAAGRRGTAGARGVRCGFVGVAAPRSPSIGLCYGSGDSKQVAAFRTLLLHHAVRRPSAPWPWAQALSQTRLVRCVFLSSIGCPKPL
jgi:hypothetical protein